ncbi:MAG: hypothetical protein ACI9MR_001798 [Myxococcota bacterium]|jgi:hypothetical protein
MIRPTQSLLLTCAATLAIAATAASALAATDPAVAAKMAEVKHDHPRLKVSIIADQFIVASNGGDKVHKGARSVIRFAARALYKEFFDTHMTKPVVAFVMKNGWHYRNFVATHLARGDTSGNLGFYEPGRRWLILNHGPGSGTLAHELVHPMIATDFPRCPTWLNEGFASLLEGKRYEDGRLIPRVNWRMRWLKGNVETVSLKRLMRTTRAVFYGKDVGLNYAAARHFLVWLRQRGHLRSFYRTFRDSPTDRTGVATVEAVTGQSIGALEADWKAWVVKQRSR